MRCNACRLESRGKMALDERVVLPGGLIHHSVQYACGDYIARLEKAGIQPSMSRAACPWDNAMAESFMRTLKRDEADGRAYRDIDDARARIGTFLEQGYDRQRLHSTLRCVPDFPVSTMGGSPDSPLTHV